MSGQLEIVQAFIGDEELIEPGGSVLVGLSGGVDSIVLADMLHRLGYGVSALHVNYSLRGKASDEDERFVEQICLRLGVTLHVERFETSAIAQDRGTSVQETARDLRYAAFERCSREAGIANVAVGHHRGDQAETVLLNIFRGTGPEGLAGMPVRRQLHEGSDVRLVRPLLCLRRDEVEAYARGRGLEWREDRTNLKPDYRRGAIRSRIIPVIEELFGTAATENIVRSAELMRAYIESGLEDDVRDAFARAAAASSRDPDAAGELNIGVLGGLDPVLRGRVVLEAIRRWLPALGGTRGTVAEVEALLESQPGRRLVHPTGVVWRDRERLLFVAATDGDEAGECRRSKEATPAAGDVAVLTPIQAVETANGTVEISMDVPPPRDISNGLRNEEFVDADRLGTPLLVRRWRHGDRFVPLGMDHSKKVSDFLTDEKVPPHRRGDVLVVQGGDEIIWVVGRRIAQTVRLRPETEHVARLRFHPAENTSIEPA